jgi:hypothetical protein
MDAISAAQAFIRSLNAPPQAHSVWIRTEVDPETKRFVPGICISVHPKFKRKIKFPGTFQGFPITQVEWPKEIG